MNYIKLFIIVGLTLTVSPHCFAATISIEAPRTVLANRQPVVVQFFLDTEHATASGITGNFSFPTDLFTLTDVSVNNSVVSLWIKQPAVSRDNYFDARTHVTFEGIFPGGYAGVRSPYYNGFKPGILFSVTLIPKNKGEGVLLVDDIELNSFSADASPLPIESSVKLISVPALTTESLSATPIEQEVVNTTLGVDVDRDPLINNNAWYLVIHDGETSRAIDHIEVAETDEYGASSVRTSQWQEVSSPHVLLFQDRSKYIHVKVVYGDHSYALTTVLPVENSHSFGAISRILVGIAVVLSLLYMYVIHFSQYIKKKY